MTPDSLVIVYAVTDDTPDGLPWPPVGDDDHHWYAVKHEHGRTFWRRVALGADDLDRFRRAAERLRHRGL
jgi:hypothetical protein